MHFIQKQILDELRSHETIRYAQLNKHNVESGHFRYHLNQLVKDGYVISAERGVYSLSNTGLKLVDKLSQNKINPASMPKVITYTLLRDGDVFLLHKKTKQPYKDLFNMIGGKLHEGELSDAAAVREVYEKTGQTITQPTLRGIFEIVISNGTLVSHAIAYVYTVEVNASDYNLLEVTDVNSVTNLAPDFLPIFNAIQSNNSVQTGMFELFI